MSKKPFRITKGMKLSDFAHESLDRSYILICIADELFKHHPSIELFPEAEKHYTDMMDYLCENYQKFGQIWAAQLDKENDKADS